MKVIYITLCSIFLYSAIQLSCANAQGIVRDSVPEERKIPPAQPTPQAKPSPTPKTAPAEMPKPQPQNTPSTKYLALPNHVIYATARPAENPSSTKVIIIGEHHLKQKDSVEAVKIILENEPKARQGKVAIGLEGYPKDMKNSDIAKSEEVKQKWGGVKMPNGKSPIYFGIEPDITPKLHFASSELLTLMYLARASEGFNERREILQEFERQAHTIREDIWIQASKDTLNEIKERIITLVILPLGDDHGLGVTKEGMNLIRGFARAGFDTEVYVLKNNGASDAIFVMALAGKNLLNNHNYSFWYNLHYKRGFGTDPYIGDYVNAYGPDRNEFGEKFNYPSPSKYKSEMEFVNDPLVIAALRDMGLREQQIQYTAKETYKYYHDKLYRELLERLVPGK